MSDASVRFGLVVCCVHYTSWVNKHHNRKTVMFNVLCRCFYKNKKKLFFALGKFSNRVSASPMDVRTVVVKKIAEGRLHLSVTFSSKSLSLMPASNATNDTKIKSSMIDSRVVLSSLSASRCNSDRWKYLLTQTSRDLFSDCYAESCSYQQCYSFSSLSAPAGNRLQLLGMCVEIDHEGIKIYLWNHTCLSHALIILVFIGQVDCNAKGRCFITGTKI